eukprot:541661_1
MATDRIANLNYITDGLGPDKWTALIRICETKEQYKDMCLFCKKLITHLSKNAQVLDIEQRNLFSIAYKNVVRTTRTSWQSLSSNSHTNINNESLTKYKTQLLNEITVYCLEAIDLVKNHLYKNVETKTDEYEAEVFYLKMMADYYRYLAETHNYDEEYSILSEKYYKKGIDCSLEKRYIVGDISELGVAHPTRLGLALNYSVCCHDILKETAKAIVISKKAFDLAVDKLEQDECGYSNLILQLIYDNITLWNQEYTKDRAIEFINGYLREIKVEYQLNIPKEMNQIFIDFYYCNIHELYMTN